MSYQAHVTDMAYCYDGSFAGFLCCVFESYARREIPAEVCPPEEGQLNFFGARDIPTDPQRARRVAAGLERLGAQVKDCITTGFLSTEGGKDLTLLRFARLCFEQGPRAAQMLGNPDAAAAFALARAVSNEACKCIEFIRFEQRDDMLGAVIHPQNYILPLLRPHFCGRFPEEDFMIYDAVHQAVLLHEGRSTRLLELAAPLELPPPSAREQQFQALWTQFYKTLEIKARHNEKGRMTHCPKRFWADMVEMQGEL